MLNQPATTLDEYTGSGCGRGYARGVSGLPYFPLNYANESPDSRLAPCRNGKRARAIHEPSRHRIDEVARRPVPVVAGDRDTRHKRKRESPVAPVLGTGDNSSLSHVHCKRGRTIIGVASAGVRCILFFLSPENINAVKKSAYEAEGGGRIVRDVFSRYYCVAQDLFA